MRQQQEKFSSELSLPRFTRAVAGVFFHRSGGCTVPPCLLPDYSVPVPIHAFGPATAPTWNSPLQSPCKELYNVFEIPDENRLCPALPLADC